MDRWYTRYLVNLLITSINGGETYDKPKNNSNNNSVSQQPQFAFALVDYYFLNNLNSFVNIV